jgi:DNA-binding response OmpR family regulator
MDVVMPVMDGFSVCAKLCESGDGSRVPILIITGLDDVDSIARAYEFGVTDFIVKPMNASIIGHRVRYMLRGSIMLNACCAARPGLAWRNGLPRLAIGSGMPPRAASRRLLNSVG